MTTTATSASPNTPLTSPSTAPNAPTAPLLATDQAADLLDRVVYEQVLECIDLDELLHLEQSLAFTAGDMPGITHERATELARSTLDRAFRRLPDDIRNYLRAVEALTCEGCELCEEEAREAHEAREPREGAAARSPRSSSRSASSRRSIRFRS